MTEQLSPGQPPLTFGQLRAESVGRYRLRYPGFPDGSPWGPRHLLTAMLGGVGEAANAVRELHLKKRGPTDASDKIYDRLGGALADVICYTDLYSFARGWGCPPDEQVVPVAPPEGWDATDISLKMGAGMGRALAAKDDQAEREESRWTRDVVLRCRQLAGFYDIDLSAVVMAKLDLAMAPGLTLEDLGLTARSYHVLSRCQIGVADLAKMTAKELLSFTNIGTVSLDDIVSALDRFGLALAPSPDARWKEAQRVRRSAR